MSNLMSFTELMFTSSLFILDTNSLPHRNVTVTQISKRILARHTPHMLRWIIQ